jgi:methylated-DNA-[protein]-cysteine S-methyltransferase
MQIQFTSIPSPIGRVQMAARDGVLCALGFDEGWDHLVEQLTTRFGPYTARTERSIPGISRALKSYFDGDLKAIDSLEVDLTGGTPFQLRIWKGLRRIPVGTTWSYAELGRRAGHENASRAVGAANGSNPVSIVVPCHRVIRSDGKLCGYGWGVARKEWLLTHEGVLLPGLLPAKA